MQGVETVGESFLSGHLFSTPLYVDGLVQESEQGTRQTGAPLGTLPRLAARVATPPQRLSPNGCRGKKSRIARLGKRRDEEVR